MDIPMITQDDLVNAGAVRTTAPNGVTYIRAYYMADVYAGREFSERFVYPNDCVSIMFMPSHEALLDVLKLIGQRLKACNIDLASGFDDAYGICWDERDAKAYEISYGWGIDRFIERDYDDYGIITVFDSGFEAETAAQIYIEEFAQFWNTRLGPTVWKPENI